jgi:hypothetical protein
LDLPSVWFVAMLGNQPLVDSLVGRSGMAQSAAANISAAKMVAVTVMAIVKSDMLIATSFCFCLLNGFTASWFQRSSLSSPLKENGKRAEKPFGTR